MLSVHEKIYVRLTIFYRTLSIHLKARIVLNQVKNT